MADENKDLAGAGRALRTAPSAACRWVIFFALPGLKHFPPVHKPIGIRLKTWEEPPTDLSLSLQPSLLQCSNKQSLGVVACLITQLHLSNKKDCLDLSDFPFPELQTWTPSWGTGHFSPFRVNILDGEGRTHVCYSILARSQNSSLLKQTNK